MNTNQSDQPSDREPLEGVLFEVPAGDVTPVCKEQPGGTPRLKRADRRQIVCLPHALDDGTIGYVRWEYQERGWAHVQSLWTIRPDGTGADSLFKQHLNDPWAVEDCRSIPGSNRFAGVAAGYF